MQQQNRYQQGTQGQFNVSLNGPQAPYSLNAPQTSFSLHSHQPQYPTSYSNNSFTTGQQGSFGQGITYNQGSPINQPQNYQQTGLNVNIQGQEGQQGQQVPPEQPPTTSIEIAAYIKKMPYTQLLAGEEFTFSVLPKKRGTFFGTNDRLLMLKGWDILCYAREFPANKQLPFVSLSDVPAPKASYPLAQVEKTQVNDTLLTIRFEGATKVAWQFVCPTKNCAIEWAQRVDAAKATAIRNGMQPNMNYQYQEDHPSYDNSPSKYGNESPRQTNYGVNTQYSSTQGQYGNQPQTYNQQYSPPRHDFTRDYSISTNSYQNQPQNYQLQGQVNVNLPQVNYEVRDNKPSSSTLSGSTGNSVLSTGSINQTNYQQPGQYSQTNQYNQYQPNQPRHF